MAGPVSVSVSPTSLSVVPGDSVQATATLRNSGQTVDQFTVTVEGLQQGWYALPVSSVALFPNDQDTIQIVLSPPKAESKGGAFPFRVRVSSQEHPAATVNVELSLQVLAFPEVRLEIAPQAAEGRTGRYRVTATNPGITEASLDLKATSADGRLRLTPASTRLIVPAGGHAEAEFHASLGWLSMFWGKKEAPFQISATVPGSSEARSLSASLVRIPWYRFLSEIRLPWLSKPPAIISLKATTEDKREFKVTWSVKRASDVRLDDDRVERQGEVVVRPPEARAYVLAATNRYGSVTQKVEVQPVTVPQARTSERIKVTLSQTQVTANAGGAPAPIVVHVQNTGQIVDKFLVDVEGIDTAWYTRSASSLALMPQASGQTQILLQPPKQKPVREGKYAFAVVVRSQANPEDATIVSCQLEVLPLIEFKVVVRPYRVTTRGKGSFRVGLTNTGVSGVSLTLGAVDMDEGLSYRFRDQAPALSAWSSIEIPMTARRKRGSVIGMSKRYDITVTASTGDGKTQTAMCEMNHAPFISSWRTIFRVVRIIIALAIIVIVVNFVLRLGGGWNTLVSSPGNWVDQFVKTVESWFSR